MTSRNDCYFKQSTWVIAIKIPITLCSYSLYQFSVASIINIYECNEVKQGKSILHSWVQKPEIKVSGGPHSLRRSLMRIRLLLLLDFDVSRHSQLFLGLWPHHFNFCLYRCKTCVSHLLSHLFSKDTQKWCLGHAWIILGNFLL